MRLLLLSTALLAGPVSAVEEAPPAAPAAIEVEIEREGDGGLAEAWRDDGAAFATYGPDGEAVVPTAERQAIQALANAYDVQFVALGAGDCAGADCVGGRPVAHRVPADTIARYALARDVAREAVDEGEAGPADAAVAYTHALAYTSDGHAWELLLCFDCGRYGLRRDGADVGAGRAGGTTQRAAFDALLGEHGAAAH